MDDRSRRRLLRSIGVIATGALAGCVTATGRTGTESPDPPSETANGNASLTEWERSTDCEGEYDGMHDSVVRVERVTNDLGDEYVPIRFADLSPGERTILRSVTEDGGYGTCDASEAFGRFVGRVGDHGERQEGDGMRVYLERDGTYYGLYVEKQDQVYAY